jgi:hypothetical protein
VDATETPSAPAARARRVATPKRLQKRKLTLAEAADQWEAAKREIERQKPLLEEAAAVLLAHFEKTGRRTLKDRIALSVSSRLVLEQDKVREFLGARLGEFQKRIQVRSLSLLK